MATTGKVPVLGFIAGSIKYVVTLGFLSGAAPTPPSIAIDSIISLPKYEGSCIIPKWEGDIPLPVYESTLELPVR